MVKQAGAQKEVRQEGVGEERYAFKERAACNQGGDM
jgi:hypothetical protein